MKKVCFFLMVCLASSICQAQIINDIMDRNPSIWYYLYTDEEIFSDELVLLFPDGSFYLERTAPMMLQYTMGTYFCHGDSLFLTSYQKLDTLDILKVEEYFNPAAVYSTIVVFSENNSVDDSRFIINGVSDTLLSDSNWVLKYNGKVNDIRVSVGDMSLFSRYTVHSPRNNIFLIHVNSEEKHAYGVGIDIILDKALFVRRGQSLYDYSCDHCGRELTRQATIPQGAELRPFRNKKVHEDNSMQSVDKDY